MGCRNKMSHHKLADAALVLCVETTCIVNLSINKSKVDKSLFRALSNVLFKISLVNQLDDDMTAFRPAPAGIKNIFGVTSREDIVPEIIAITWLISKLSNNDNDDMIPLVKALKKFAERDVKNPEFAKSVNVLATSLEKYNHRRESLV